MSQNLCKYLVPPLHYDSCLVQFQQQNLANICNMMKSLISNFLHDSCKQNKNINFTFKQSGDNTVNVEFIRLPHLASLPKHLGFHLKSVFLSLTNRAQFGCCRSSGLKEVFKCQFLILLKRIGTHYLSKQKPHLKIQDNCVVTKGKMQNKQQGNSKGKSVDDIYFIPTARTLMFEVINTKLVNLLVQKFVQKMEKVTFFTESAIKQFIHLRVH